MRVVLSGVPCAYCSTPKHRIFSKPRDASNLQVSSVSIIRLQKWSGQDPHHCTRSLQLYLPKLVVWLDIEDLDDVGKLEEYIDESAVILIFYSENDFRSINCRREFYTAVALEKPIIVVCEGDDSVMDTMKEECAKYYPEKYRNEGIDINHMLENVLAKDPICILKAGSISAESLKVRSERKRFTTRRKKYELIRESS